MQADDAADRIVASPVDNPGNERKVNHFVYRSHCNVRKTAFCGW
jgi:hypothetical protein